MGFWSWLKDKAETALAIAAAPIIIPAAVIGYTGEKIGKKLGLISEDVGQTAELNETSTVSQVEDISNAVGKYYSEYAQIAEAKEKAAQKNIDIFFDGIKNLLQKKPQLVEDYGMSTLNRKKDRLCRDIEGTITDAIRTKLSLDNSECRKILSMKASNEKSRKMKEFADRTIQNANKNLENKIRQAMTEVKNDISRFLENKMDEQEDKARSDQQNFDNWIQQMENKTFDSEKAQLEPRVKIYAIEQVEKIFAA